MSYFKYIIYFLLSILDSFFNLLCSIFRYYPSVDIASSFLSRVELMRVHKIIGDRQEEKVETSKEALENVEKIKYGKDSPKRAELGQAQTKEKS